MTIAISPFERVTTVEPVETFEDAVEALAAGLCGWLLRPGDEEYEEARLIRNASIDCFPAVVVQAETAEDVAQAVRFARRHGLTISIRSGGHSFAGHSVNTGGIVIDLRYMQALSIDPEMRTARCQPGVTSGVLAAAAQEYGLALSTGDTSSVALGGLTLGGGIGFMAREQGLTIDNLLSAEMVTADGRIVRASAEENPDLFWALRGGGGNFGVVTEFEFRLHHVGTVLGGMVGLPATPEMLRAYADWAIAAPDSLTTICFLMAAPPAPFVPEDAVGELTFAVFLVCTGDIEAAQQAIAPLRQFAPPIFEVVAPMPYPAIYEFTEDGTARAREVCRSLFFKDLPDAVIEVALDAMRAGSPLNMLQVRTLGGQVSRVPADVTAYAHRDASYQLTAIGVWEEGGDGAAETRWANDFLQAVSPYGSGVYVNFLQHEAARIQEAYPPATYRRLAEVKRRFDPENVFSQNQNVRPAED